MKWAQVIYYSSHYVSSQIKSWVFNFQVIFIFCQFASHENGDFGNSSSHLQFVEIWLNPNVFRNSEIIRLYYIQLYCHCAQYKSRDNEMQLASNQKCKKKQ